MKFLFLIPEKSAVVKTSNFISMIFLSLMTLGGCNTPIEQAKHRIDYVYQAPDDLYGEVIVDGRSIGGAFNSGHVSFEEEHYKLNREGRYERYNISAFSFKPVPYSKSQGLDTYFRYFSAAPHISTTHINEDSFFPYYQFPLYALQDEEDYYFLPDYYPVRLSRNCYNYADGWDRHKRKFVCATSYKNSFPKGPDSAQRILERTAKANNGTIKMAPTAMSQALWEKYRPSFHVNE